MNKMFSPDTAHNRLMQLKPLLAFDENKDFEAQKKEISDRFRVLLGNMPEQPENDGFRIEYQHECDGYTDTRFVFTTEPDVQAVCHLWVPNTGLKKYPLVICLQGHSTGMHISMGRPVFARDVDSIAGGDRDFGRQIIREHCAALMVEQRGMGERRTPDPEKPDGGEPRCHIPTMTALLLGRTMIGERVWDVRRAIDMMAHFDCIDSEKIACMGNSGGGTVTFYAACMDERIRIAMPSCSVCTYKDSIAAMSHCVCNFIPGIAQYLDMGDLAAMIAPRKLIVVAGKKDPIFPIHGVNEAFDTIRKIYDAAGAPENCRLVLGNEGHRFYAAQAWPVFHELAENG